MLYRLIRTREDSMIAILRLMLGVLFVIHGSQKMLGLFGGPGFVEALRTFETMGIPKGIAIVAISAEFFGGIGLVVGFLSRVAALGIVTNMVVAIAMLHQNQGFFMNWDGAKIGEGLEFHLLVIAIGLAILVRGGGAVSADLTLTQSMSHRIIDRELERPRMVA